MNVGQYAKSLVAGLTAFGSAFTVAQADGVTGAEWVNIGVATAVALLAVWVVPNSAASDQTGTPVIPDGAVVNAESATVVADEVEVPATDPQWPPQTA